ncbi:hypothetical protein [Methylophaga sp.]|uniref:hypothetical protein n=1 Tax=Methylophaga sp. TaxID=2024840 RepID=UPI003A8DB221
MTGITKEQAQAKLDTWLAADERLAKGQSVSISGRSITHAEALKNIQFWDKKVRQLTRGGKRIRLAVPNG